MASQQSERTFKTYQTAEVVLAFARQGVALDTIARALVVNASHVQAVVSRALSSGDLVAGPPASSSDRRTALPAEVAHLRAEVDTLRAVIKETTSATEESLGRMVGVAGLTKYEATIVDTLLKGRRASKASLYQAIYGFSDKSPDPKIIDVFTCKLRQKLAPHGITIETIWGFGYVMPPESCARMRALAGLPIIADAPSLVPTQMEEV